jgi:phosphoglycolate phosphatase-like HAD superfamily hydrolase
LRELADVVVTRSDADASKPDPDVVLAAVKKLDLTPYECVMVGDTIFDAQACQAAGVVFLGVLSGGTPADELLDAGAIGVWKDIAHLLGELDQALEVASGARVTIE